MRSRLGVLSGALLSISLLAGTALSQEHEEHHKAAPPATTATPEQHTRTPGMPSMGMNSCPHMQMGPIADQLLASFAGMEKEQDMAVLKTKLAAHGALLRQLQQAANQKCPMMEHKGMMGGMSNMGGMQQPNASQ